MIIKLDRVGACIGLAGAGGAALLTTQHHPVLTAFLAGAALGALAVVILCDLKLTRQQAEYAASKERYDAAYATLCGQRERIRVNAEATVADQQRQALLREHVAGYTEGALHALQGRLDPDVLDQTADVIALADRRPASPQDA